MYKTQLQKALECFRHSGIVLLYLSLCVKLLAFWCPVDNNGWCSLFCSSRIGDPCCNMFHVWRRSVIEVVWSLLELCFEDQQRQMSHLLQLVPTSQRNGSWKACTPRATGPVYGHCVRLIDGVYAMTSNELHKRANVMDIVVLCSTTLLCDHDHGVLFLYTTPWGPYLKHTDTGCGNLTPPPLQYRFSDNFIPSSITITR